MPKVVVKISLFQATTKTQHSASHVPNTVGMMTSPNGNIFRATGPLCGKFTSHRWIPLTKASDAELWCFLWYSPWMNGWVNNREAGDLRRHRANYGFIVTGRAENGIISCKRQIVFLWYQNKRSSENTISSCTWVPAKGSHISLCIKNCT